MYRYQIHLYPMDWKSARLKKPITAQSGKPLMKRFAITGVMSKARKKITNAFWAALPAKPIFGRWPGIEIRSQEWS